MNETVTQEAHRLVGGDRQGDYGHPYDDFSRTAAMWTAILRDQLKPGETIAPSIVGIMMIAVKISRQINRPKRDNLVDIAGYAQTVDMVIEKTGELQNLIHDPSSERTA